MTDPAEFPCISNSSNRFVYCLRFAVVSICLCVWVSTSYAAKEEAKSDEERPSKTPRRIQRRPMGISKVETV